MMQPVLLTKGTVNIAKKGGIMWVARDKDGYLFLYGEKPKKEFSSWVSPECFNLFILDVDLFPEVKWEDEEPTEVELIIKQK